MQQANPERRVNGSKAGAETARKIMKRHRTLITLCLLPAITAFFGLRAGSGQNSKPSYQNPTLPFETRVNDLVSRMTLEEKVSQMMNSAPAIPRLGIPEYDWWNEALHGVAFSGEATVFPQAIGLGATFDQQLVGRVASVISTEARAKYNEPQRRGHRAP